MICEQVSNTKIFQVNVFNICCSFILFMILLFKTKHCRGTTSSVSVPLKMRGVFYQNVQKLSIITCIWNWMWFAFQGLMALSSIFDTAPFYYTLMIVKAAIWAISVYIEFTMFFFVSTTINATNGILQKLNYISTAIGFAGGTGSILIDLLSPKSYYMYDFYWSIFRVMVSICTSCIKSRRYESWSIFMGIVYLMNSTQEIMHELDVEYFYCVRLTTKLCYFVAFVPVLYYTLEKNNENWNRIMVEEIQKVAREWTSNVEELFPGEEKIDKIATGVRSVQYSPFRDFILDRRDFVDLKKEIGSGSFGQVKLYSYRGKNVAVKFVLSSELIGHGEPSDTILLFKKEFSNFLKLQSCKQVVKLVGLFFDIDSSGPKFGIAMEYATNGTLYDNLPIDIAIYSNELYISYAYATLPKCNILPHLDKIALDLAKGLQYMHNVLNMTFVDLKPANIVIDEKFNAKFIDLGSIVTTTTCTCCATQHNRVATFTEAYAAPELLKDGVSSTESDIWSFGFILWQLFTGIKCPLVFTGKSPVLIDNSHNVLEYYVNRRLRPPIPKMMPVVLSSMITQCWNINPSERPSINSIIDTLNQLNSPSIFYIIDEIGDGNEYHNEREIELGFSSIT